MQHRQPDGQRPRRRGGRVLSTPEGAMGDLPTAARLIQRQAADGETSHAALLTEVPPDPAWDASFRMLAAEVVAAQRRLATMERALGLPAPAASLAPHA